MELVNRAAASAAVLAGAALLSGAVKIPRRIQDWAAGKSATIAVLAVEEVQQRPLPAIRSGRQLECPCSNPIKITRRVQDYTPVCPPALSCLRSKRWITANFQPFEPGRISNTVP